jgi:type IV pilus assembly protein PilY1
VAYVGRVIHDGSLPWRGKMHRLTTGGCSAAPCTTATWGIALGFGSYRTPTEVLDTFPPSGSSLEPGPITTAPAVTVDDSNKVWLFFGTGRFYGSDDKTNAETQYFFGIKDSVFSGCTETSVSSCHDNDLVNVSSAIVCVVCTGAQVTGVSGVTTLEGTSSTSLQGLVASKDGWYTTLPTSRERALVTPTLIGGVVFFPTYVPVNDICQASGDG